MDYRQFLFVLLQHYDSTPGFRIELQKIYPLEPSAPLHFKVKKVRTPQLIFEKSKVTKNEELWKRLKYRNYSAKQLYKRYKKVVFNEAVREELKLKGIDLNPLQLAYFRKIDKTLDPAENRAPIVPKEEEIVMEMVGPAQVKEDYKKLFCLCRRKYKDGDDMMACDFCGEWFHYECLGLIGGEEMAS